MPEPAKGNNSFMNVASGNFTVLGWMSAPSIYAHPTGSCFLPHLISMCHYNLQRCYFPDLIHRLERAVHLFGIDRAISPLFRPLK